MRVLPSGTLFQTPDLDNFASAYRSSKSLIDLARQGRRSERDQLDHRRSTKSDNTSGLRRSTAVVYHSDRRALSAARFRRGVLLATADTCSNVNTVSRARDGIYSKSLARGQHAAVVHVANEDRFCCCGHCQKCCWKVIIFSAGY